MKKLLIVVLILVLAVGVFAYRQYTKQAQISKINSFEECTAAGFPISESYPPQCRTSDGRSFTQNIGNENKYIDEIIVENPRPNQKIASPLEIKGRARGTWYFEANFSAELFDANDKRLGTAIITARGDWMTEDFVPFTGELSFDTPATEKGRLIIRNANPSDFPENSKELIIPVAF